MMIDFQLLETAVHPKEISRRTGIRASVALARGERNALLVLPRINVWSLESSVESDEVGAHWDDLEKVLKNSREELREIAKSGRAVLTIVIPSGERLPSLQIPPAMSEFAGFVGALIDIDHLQ